MTKLFDKVIAQWKEDLLDKDFPKFNMDYEIIEHPGKTFEGDAALFLAYRIVEDLTEFYKHNTGWAVITKYTNIPIDRARELLWPTVLLEDSEFDLSSITPEQFISVLDVYLETGIVDWEIIL